MFIVRCRVSLCVEREKQVATVLELFIVTHQSAANFPILFRASCILFVATERDSDAFQRVKSSGCRVLFMNGEVSSAMSFIYMLKWVGEITPPSLILTEWLRLPQSLTLTVLWLRKSSIQ